MNKVILCGRLVREPEIRYTQSSDPMCIAKYTLAVNRKLKKDGEPSADFVNCVAFKKAGEFAEKYLKQGTKIIVSGRIQTGNYTNKDGNKVYTTDVVVEEHEFAESKNANSSSSYQSNQPLPPPASSVPGSDDWMQIPPGIEDELPFN